MMSRTVVSTLAVLSLASSEDAVSLLQLHAAKQDPIEPNGLCGLGIFTKTQANTGATFDDMVKEFTEKCNVKYEGQLCEEIEKELFDGLDPAAVVADNGEKTQALCEELGALLSADGEHDDVVNSGSPDSALYARTQNGDGSSSLEQAVGSKGSPRRRNPPPRRRAPPRCHRGHCSNHGNTNDNNANDGCSCTCDAGWTGGNCGTAATTTTTTTTTLSKAEAKAAAKEEAAAAKAAAKEEAKAAKAEEKAAAKAEKAAAKAEKEEAKAARQAAAEDKAAAKEEKAAAKAAKQAAKEEKAAKKAAKAARKAQRR